jgi:hypothetical protein
MSVFSALLHCQDKHELESCFKHAIQSLNVEQLHLQQVVSQGSIALQDGIETMLLSTEQDERQLIIKAGIFFRSIIAGCNCADDPGPIDTLEEYAEAWFSISRMDGSFSISYD